MVRFIHLFHHCAQVNETQTVMPYNLEYLWNICNMLLAEAFSKIQSLTEN